MLEPIPRRREVQICRSQVYCRSDWERDYPLGNQVWGDNRIPLTNGSPHYWRDVITGQILETDGFLYARDVLQHFPVDLLLSGDGRREFEEAAYFYISPLFPLPMA